MLAQAEIESACITKDSVVSKARANIIIILHRILQWEEELWWYNRLKSRNEYFIHLFDPKHFPNNSITPKSFQSFSLSIFGNVSAISKLSSFLSDMNILISLRTSLLHALSTL